MRPPHGAGGSGGAGAAAGFDGTRDRSTVGAGKVDGRAGVGGPAIRPRVNAVAATTVRVSAETSPGRGLAMARQPRHRGPPNHGRFRSESSSPQSQQNRVRLGIRSRGSFMTHDRASREKVAQHQHDTDALSTCPRDTFMTNP